jgi:hypothetical protein
VYCVFVCATAGGPSIWRQICFLDCSCVKAPDCWALSLRFFAWWFYVLVPFFMCGRALWSLDFAERLGAKTLVHVSTHYAEDVVRTLQRRGSLSVVVS